MKNNIPVYIQQILACPTCGGDLLFSDNQSINQSIYCTICNKYYPIIDDILRFVEVDDQLLLQAKIHWEDSPNYQYEAKSSLYSMDYYEEQDKWRKEEIDPYIMNEYQFESIKGKIILDVGCGSGWVVKQASMNGAYAIGVDFTEKACISTKRALETYGLEGLVIQADAQKLPIKSNMIDRFFSIGVLHHLPNTELGVSEAFRVMKNGGTGLISLYGKLFFFNPILFPIAISLLKMFINAPTVRNGIQYAKNYDEFYRLMDGPTNPIGRWYTNHSLKQLFYKFRIVSITKSHFPLRYLKLLGVPMKRFIPNGIHRLLENNFGMMRNVQLYKE